MKARKGTLLDFRVHRNYKSTMNFCFTVLMYDLRTTLAL